MNNWISVDDRLPEFGEDVLVWEKYSTKPFIGFYSQQERWVVDQEFVEPVGGCIIRSYIDQKLITHWQPLPPPPMESHEVKEVKELQECLSNLCTAYRMVVGLDGAYDTSLTDAERLLKRLSERHYE